MTSAESVIVTGSLRPGISDNPWNHVMRCSALLLSLVCFTGFAAEVSVPVTADSAAYDLNADGVLDASEQAAARTRGWTRSTTVTGAHGGTSTRSTTGTTTSNGDGTGSTTSVTTGTATGAAGRDGSWTTERSAAWKRNDQGGRDIVGTSTTTTGNGTVVQRETTGSTAATDDGRTWERTTTGTSSTGKSWTTEASGSVTRTGDGTAAVESTKTITGAQGGTKTVTTTGTVTKTEDGHSFSGDRSVVRGDGTSRAASVERQVQRDGDQRERTTTVQRDGAGAKGAARGSSRSRSGRR